jgi:hypothetical protein
LLLDGTEAVPMVMSAQNYLEKMTSQRSDAAFDCVAESMAIELPDWNEPRSPAKRKRSEASDDESLIV